jgi:hypothetical protein
MDARVIELARTWGIAFAVDRALAALVMNKHDEESRAEPISERAAAGGALQTVTNPQKNEGPARAKAPAATRESWEAYFAQRKELYASYLQATRAAKKEP